MSKLVTDVKLYAKLLNSVGVRGTGPNHKRPLTPVQCAEAIRRLLDEEEETLEEISKRLNLGKPKKLANMYQKRDTTQVGVFLSLLNISEKSRDLAGWPYEKYPKIPFSIMARMSTMLPDDQDTIIQSMFSERDKTKVLIRTDIDKIKAWRKEHPDLPISEGIRKILNLKPTTVTTHLLVLEISGNLDKFVKSNPDYKEKLLDMLRASLDGKFHDINVGRSVMVISMDEHAYKIFHESQYKKGVSYTQFINNFLEK